MEPRKVVFAAVELRVRVHKVQKVGILCEVMDSSVFAKANGEETK